MQKAKQEAEPDGIGSFIDIQCSSLSQKDDEAMLELVPALRSLRSQRLPPPSFALAPAVPLPLWQRVALSSLEGLQASLHSQRRFKHIRQALSRDLSRYHLALQERAERMRRQQRESRACAGERVAAGVQRYWSRRGDVYQQLAKVEFDVMKHQHDRRKQEDLLHETEELTRKLLESIFSASRRHVGNPSSPSDPEPAEYQGTSLGDPVLPQSLPPVDDSAHASFWDRVGDDDEAPIEEALSLLDTEEGRRPLRHYQRSALRWMVHLYENNLNGILADEMGLGKTVQTIALLCYFAEYRNDWGPHLIVVPTTVVLNWKAELERWAPGLKVLTYIGTAKERHLLRKGWTSEDAFHICVTSYNLVVQDRKVFRRRPWGFLVLDEAHHVKNFMSLKWQSLFDLQAEYRLLLTGTPLQNSIMELWSLFHFLLPFASAFRSNAEFKEWFSNPMDEMITGRSSLNEEVVRRLQALLRPFMLRRLKKDVETQLPTKTEKVVLCRLARRQRSLYDDYMQLAETKQKLRGGGTGGVLSVLLALRKVCDHPDLFEPRPTISPLVLGRDAAVVTLVPRQVLQLVDHCRTRWRFPAFHVFDMNDDRVSAANAKMEEQDRLDTHLDRTPHPLLMGDTAVPWWLVRTPMCHPDVFTAADMARYAERYNPIAFAGHTTGGGWEIGGRVSSLTSTIPFSVGCSGASLTEAYRTALHDAEQQRRLRRARTEAAQLQRFYAAQVAHNEYVSPMCQVQTRQTCLVQQHPALCPSVADRAAALLPILEKVCVYVPAVLAVYPPTLRWLSPIRYAAPFEALDRETCAPLIGAVAKIQDAARTGREAPRLCYDASFFGQEMWPLQVRRSFSFPDKRLLIHDCGKLQFLEEALKRMRQERHRVLIFTQFIHMLNILERFLALIGVSYMRLDGSTKVELRQHYVDRFNADPRITCMILSTRSGGIGLNLTGADTVIFYDSDWNPTMDLQAQDRCHRIGQTRPVTIYRLISEHTVEESILQKARERKKLNNVVIRGGQFHTIAGVSEQYDDSAAAFAALSDPVNLRSFFHDLDEDATVDLRPSRAIGTPSPGAEAPSFEAIDVLREMAIVEDEEDKVAGQELEREMAAHAAEEKEAAEEGDGDEMDALLCSGSAQAVLHETNASGKAVVCADDDVLWRTKRPNSILDALLSVSPDLPLGGVGVANDALRSFNGGDTACASQEAHSGPPARAITQAIQKRQRELVTKSHAPVDQFLALTYGRYRRDDAEARFDALAVSYEATMNDRSDDSESELVPSGDFQPRFRTEFQLGS